MYEEPVDKHSSHRENKRNKKHDGEYQGVYTSVDRAGKSLINFLLSGKSRRRKKRRKGAR